METVVFEKYSSNNDYKHQISQKRFETIVQNQIARQVKY